MVLLRAAFSHSALDHPIFKRLGRSASERQKEYRALFRARLDEEFVEALRKATNGDWALGSERFARTIANAANRRAAPLAKAAPLPRPQTNAR